MAIINGPTACTHQPCTSVVVQGKVHLYPSPGALYFLQGPAQQFKAQA